MSKLYSEKHRALQERFDAQRLADFIEANLVHDAFEPEEKAFVESRDMFFLSTLDADARPTVSYKGGTPGFVTVTGPSSLAFPNYDGNGMYYSMGNIMVAPRIGMLFIDFETPHRLRVQGKADIDFKHALMKDHPDAQFIVDVKVEEIWVNCPRYIHRYKKIENSRYTPEPGKATPEPAWKRINVVQDALPEKDKNAAESHGSQITLDEYAELVAKGEA